MARLGGSRRALLVVIGAMLVAGLGALALQSPTARALRTRSVEEMADEIGAPVMEHLRRGHVAGRSGQVMLVPRPHHYLVGEWDLTTLWTDSPETFVSHPNPWSYLTHVPIIFFGPDVVRRGARVASPVDVADIAPTYAELLGLEGFESDGQSLASRVISAPPELEAIATIVLDGGGWNVLQDHPRSWPVLAKLAETGTTYVNATVGSAPSLTGAIHSTMGTGRYPRAHGIPNNPWLTLTDPQTLRVPTVSELWDEAQGNEPVVAMTGFESPHVGMIGHGSQRRGGDRDVAVFWDSAHSSWRTNAEFYRAPGYLLPTDKDKLASYEMELDGTDGFEDGSWLGHRLEELAAPDVRPGTPAYARFSGDAVIEIIRNERIGADATTDLLWVELKMPDYAGHLWNMVAAEQAAVLREVDRQIGRVKEELDARVGRGAYLLVVTADHGQEPLPELSGGWRIGIPELERDIEAAFGPICKKVTTLDLQLDMEVVERNGVDLTEVAEFFSTYSLGDNIPQGAPGVSRVPAGRLGEPLFAGAFPTGFLQDLTPAETAAYGKSIYPEGSFPVRKRS